MIRTAFLIVGLLWLAKRAAHAKQVQNAVVEMMPVDPYSAITWQWDALNGTNLTPAGANPNAHPSHYLLNVGGLDPQISNPCVCK